MHLREESAADVEAIDEIYVAAFATDPHSLRNEHAIVRALRARGTLSVSLVAESGGEVVGHVAVSPVAISDGAAGWYGLGPVAVHPKRQGRGIGRRLVAASLERIRACGARGCVVVGEPGFYSKFGFSPDAALVLPGVPPQYFQLLRFGGAMPRGEVAYDEAFAAAS